jgi:hypothetical protein
MRWRSIKLYRDAYLLSSSKDRLTLNLKHWNVLEQWGLRSSHCEQYYIIRLDLINGTYVGQLCGYCCSFVLCSYLCTCLLSLHFIFLLYLNKYFKLNGLPVNKVDLYSALYEVIFHYSGKLRCGFRNVKSSTQFDRTKCIVLSPSYSCQCTCENSCGNSSQAMNVPISLAWHIQN